MRRACLRAVLVLAAALLRATTGLAAEATDPPGSLALPAGPPTAPAPAHPAAAEATAEAVSAAAPAPPAAPEPPLVTLGYSRGYVMRSAKDEAELRLNASTHVDTRLYFGGNHDTDSFDIRRARIEFSGKYAFVQLRLQAALEDAPYVRNAYLDVGPWASLRLRVGQFKAPLSSQWLAQDNEVDFLETWTGEPLLPFLDRGAMLWGDLFEARFSYCLGIFNGNGIEPDAARGDQNDTKELAFRLFAQPLRVHKTQGLFLAVGGTYEPSTTPTRRFEGGLTAPTFESQTWRWRTEQTLGTNGRDTDLLTAEIGRKLRASAELHFLHGPFTFSSEWILLRYEDVTIFHDYQQGSSRLVHTPVSTLSGGTVNTVSAFASLYLTGEGKSLSNMGWVQPLPANPLTQGRAGAGAWEILLRASATLSTGGLFARTNVAGFAQTDIPGAKGPVPATGASVTAQILQGASKVYELTAGLNWTINDAARVMVNYTYLVDPDFADGRNGIVSGSRSELPDSNPTKLKLKRLENELGLRLLLRI